MKRYLIACIDDDITNPETVHENMTFSNPTVFTYESNQMLDDVVSKYHLNLRIDASIPTIVFALTDLTDASSASVIVKTIGRKFKYADIYKYRMYIDGDSSICIDALVDNSDTVDFSKILPKWLAPTKKRLNIFAAKNL